MSRSIQLKKQREDRINIQNYSCISVSFGNPTSFKYWDFAGENRWKI